ncbi:AAA family ATPase [Anaerocolumna chitinilytica]|uniref:DNA helicase n=1 Tax=Anaerocolumna chitinilytica TaxID=1727145 RepID=A0A7I8DJQ0_9FIRM|nr:AAA family ATPase [Anaerocolumna chitinilytica]BCJ97574.1 hypothetical protein bsdcttw_06150 [Anaerocolumna chitinilytica]
MPIRLWPSDYEKKEHISKEEKALLRNAAKNFNEGHIVVGIDPVGMSSDSARMGMYISPKEGLVTFTILNGSIETKNVDAYAAGVSIVETRIYQRLLDSKSLIVKNSNYKILKFPYKHIFMFYDQELSSIKLTEEQIDIIGTKVTGKFFTPLTSYGKVKYISDLNIFKGIEKDFDCSFNELTDMEERAIFERLAPEYTVVMNEIEKVTIKETKAQISEDDLKITGKEMEYKTFFLDEFQVALVNDMGKGHRVLLANPGSGKSVLLLSKAFKYASLYKDANVLLTCFNDNLSDSYIFKRSCADFGFNNNLHIMTFHKLVKKIYEECLHSRCESHIATEEEIRYCIECIRQGVIKLSFKAIFIDEVQIFDPLYLELCYLLLNKSEDGVFLMAGDLNQTVRSQSRRGDAPWKKINTVSLDFTGRVRYIKKNYRNSKRIGEYLNRMLCHMNKRMDMLDMIVLKEYDYDTFTVGDKQTLALKIETGVDRFVITNKVVEAIVEITQKHKISYSDIAILFPYRQYKLLKYYFLYWVQQALDDKGIPYSMIINDGIVTKKKYSDTNGVVLSTIDSSLGLDFKAVIVAGLYPYNYVFDDKLTKKKISSWNTISKLSPDQQEKVQIHMRKVYTACSRARDILYVISDLETETPLEEILKV